MGADCKMAKLYVLKLGWTVWEPIAWWQTSYPESGLAGMKAIAQFFGHASAQHPFESMRCYEAWLVIVRRLSEKIKPDACLKFAIIA